MAQELNSALHRLFRDHPRLSLLGEDVLDPYGGAFGITRGLSEAHPERVVSTPISEGAIIGMAGGMALCGDPVVVEVMFGDFITLGFDPIVNFISKSVTMYGRTLPMPVVVRCPVGGNRGYGPTHSQHPMKHFVGVPNLHLYELSPVHDVHRQLERMLTDGAPAIHFEDKVLYTTSVLRDGVVDDLFGFGVVPGDPDGNWVEVGVPGEPADVVLVAPGGLVPRAVGAMRSAVLEHELSVRLLVPARLYPLDLAPIRATLAAAARIVVLEDGAAGGGWSAELARRLYEELWPGLRGPIEIVQPACEVIPAAPVLERRVLIQESTILDRLIGGRSWATS